MATALKRTVYTRTSGAAVPAVREAADPALQRFLDAVWLERGLSANTLAAYRADLTALARWLEERDGALLKATRIELLGFIAARVGRLEAPVDRSAAVEFSTFLSFHDARGFDRARSDRANRHAENRPIPAQIAD